MRWAFSHIPRAEAFVGVAVVCAVRGGMCAITARHTLVLQRREMVHDCETTASGANRPQLAV